MPHASNEHADLAVSIRPVTPADVQVLYEIQRDPLSNQMAGTKPWSEEAFNQVWTGIFADPTVTARAIVRSGRVIGSISCFRRDGVHEIGYWLDREHWGRGIASTALALLLKEVAVRPLHATAQRSNAGSIKVLERCGFRVARYSVGEETPRYTAGELVHFVLEERRPEATT